MTFCIIIFSYNCDGFCYNITWCFLFWDFCSRFLMDNLPGAFTNLLPRLIKYAFLLCPQFLSVVFFWKKLIIVSISCVEKFAEAVSASCIPKTCSVQFSGPFISSFSSHGMNFSSMAYSSGILSFNLLLRFIVMLPQIDVVVCAHDQCSKSR